MALFSMKFFAEEFKSLTQIEKVTSHMRCLS